MQRVRTTREPRRAGRRIAAPYKILVASAGDPSSLGAIHVALALARRRSASVHVLAVVPPFPHGAPSVLNIAPPSVIDDVGRREALELVRHQLAPVRGTKNWAMRASIGWPADRIIEAAERWPADLVVVGMGEHGVVDRMIGSETAVSLARRCPVPVLVVPADARGLPVHAVAAIDFSESSVRGGTLAASLLGANGTLTLVHASALIKDAPEPGSLLDVYTIGATGKLEAIRDSIHRITKRTVRAEAISGAIIDQLVSRAERAEFDLIALGGHDQGTLDRLVFGSVRTRVLRESGCAVLIAPGA